MWRKGPSLPVSAERIEFSARRATVPQGYPAQLQPTSISVTVDVAKARPGRRWGTPTIAAVSPLLKLGTPVFSGTRPA